MGRIQGLMETPQVLTENALIKTGVGYVFSITIAWTGANVGDMAYLRDGLTAAAKVLVCFAFPTANGTINKEWPQGKKFETGLFYDEGPAHNVYAELTYK